MCKTLIGMFFQSECAFIKENWSYNAITGKFFKVEWKKSKTYKDYLLKCLDMKNIWE